MTMLWPFHWNLSLLFYQGSPKWTQYSNTEYSQGRGYGGNEYRHSQQGNSLFQALTLPSCSQILYSKAAFYPAHLSTVWQDRFFGRRWLKPKKMTSTIALRAMIEGDHIGQAPFVLHKPMLAVLSHLLFFMILEMAATRTCIKFLRDWGENDLSVICWILSLTFLKARCNSFCFQVIRNVPWSPWPFKEAWEQTSSVKTEVKKKQYTSFFLYLHR